jgi:hypothetical protein
MYFANWHKITTYHINRNSPFQELFIKNRINVFQRFADRIARALKFSDKFISLCWQAQLNLCEKIYDFLIAGQEWMGKCKTTLSEVIIEKYKVESNVFYKSLNSELKGLVSEEFSLELLNTEGQNNANYGNSKINMAESWSEQNKMFRT